MPIEQSGSARHPSVVLFLQLPLLDVDTGTPAENVSYAGLYLERALRGDPEGRFWDVRFQEPEWDDLGLPALARAVTNVAPRVVAVTLFLWNIERTLALLRRVTEDLPGVFVVAGGPEVDAAHPLLFQKRSGIDAVVVGEGEAVFPGLLSGVRTGRFPDWTTVRLRERGFQPGRHPPAVVDLSAAQPSAVDLMRLAASRSTVYLESARGCPMRCAYCRYPQLQQALRCVDPALTARTVREIAAWGAREIRFVDPTFNSHPRFDDLIELLVDINRARDVTFFAELRADTLRREQAQALARAGFAEVEVGLQSSSPRALRAIRRPARPEAIRRGVRMLLDAGLKVTLDVMYGLPEQDEQDVFDSVKWGLALGAGVRVQCMRTLLLPGTEIRRNRLALGVEGDVRRPPYAVRRTQWMTPGAFRRIERFIEDHPELPGGIRTPRFVGRRLPGLFPVRHRIDAARLSVYTPVPGESARRTLTIHGFGLAERTKAIAEFVRRCVLHDRFAVWQFVLAPETEEPLDLFEAVVAALHEAPAELADRLNVAERSGKRCSRKLFLRTFQGADPEWEMAVERLLARHFL